MTRWRTIPRVLLMVVAQAGAAATISFSSLGVPQTNLLCLGTACDSVAIAPSAGSLSVQPGVGGVASIFTETLNAGCLSCGTQSGTAKVNDLFSFDDGSGAAQATVSYTIGVTRGPGSVAFFSSPGQPIAPIVFPDGAQLLLGLPVFDPLPVANGSSTSLSVPAGFVLISASPVPEPRSGLLIAGALVLSIVRKITSAGRNRLLHRPYPLRAGASQPGGRDDRAALRVVDRICRRRSSWYL